MAPAACGAAQGGSLSFKAFVVEDQAGIREGLIDALSEISGVTTVGWAANERDALAWLREPANAWDIAIVDLVLEPGGGSGYGVLKALGQRGSTRKVVVLTATAEPAVRRQCESLGADGVFDKAMETDAMLDYCSKLARAAGGH
jgi:DNA-binding NarL/FixJ family response regulator